MSEKKATVHWEGQGKNGQGRISTETDALKGYPYGYASRFEDDRRGTNPEELLGAAHAGCFTMALTAQLSRARLTPERIHTEARVKLEKVGDAFAITRIELETEAMVPGIDDATFQQYALDAKQNCPVSKALAGTEIHLSAKLI